ncbi:hypothetical protein TRIUR3_22197 [Triticum urartu]|uniref:Oligopeptidase A N-terminal domain-containing protein n=1 Tax=Triticum urartu TaxID=4572 RepID=M7ZQA0_TRIUA|nr:hypothetical protein TRIUR3_22197 [Triticum urartu]
MADADSNSNPLLADIDFPPFDRVEPGHVRPGIPVPRPHIRALLARLRQTSFRLGMLEKLKSFRGMDNFRRSKDSPGKRGDTPLHLAARASNVSNIQRILAESGQEMAELEEGELEELEKGVEPAWERLVHPLERIIDRLNVIEGVHSVHPEAYEFKIGDQFFRRPGDPPLDQVIEML